MIDYTSQYDDEKLMQQVKAGNMFAFDALYMKYSKRLYKFVFSILKSQEDSKNIVQEGFLQLWEKRSSVKKDVSVKSFIFTIAYHSAVAVLREKAKESKYLDYLKTLQHPEEEPEDIEQQYTDMVRQVEVIINSLPARQKEIYLLNKVQKLKYKEIAERLNISVNTVETLMSRSLKTIREKIGKPTLSVLLFTSLFI